MKILAKILGIGVLLAGLGWLGLSLSWHFKIVGAIQTLESGAAPPKPGSPVPYSVPDEPLQELQKAGCRALPYLVNSLAPAKNQAYLVAAADLIQKAVAPADPAGASDFPGDSKFLYEEPAADRERKCEVIKEWWRARGPEHHQGWRVWTDRCPPP